MHSYLIPSENQQHMTTGSLKTDKIELEYLEVNKKVRWNETMEHTCTQREHPVPSWTTINALTRTHEEDEPLVNHALIDKDASEWRNTVKGEVNALGSMISWDQELSAKCSKDDIPGLCCVDDELQTM